MTDVVLLLEQIERAAQNARAHMAGLSKEQFLVDKKTQDAVCYALIGLGEAAKRLRANVRDGYGSIPLDEAVKTRDYLAHGYTTVQPVVLWDTVERDIGPLIEEVARVRAEIGRESGQSNP